MIFGSGEEKGIEEGVEEMGAREEFEGVEEMGEGGAFEGVEEMGEEIEEGGDFKKLIGMGEDMLLYF